MISKVRRSQNVSIGFLSAGVMGSGLTTKAQRPGARGRSIATATLPPGSLQRVVRPRCHLTSMMLNHTGKNFVGGSSTPIAMTTLSPAAKPVKGCEPGFARNVALDNS